jgi:hypothetical protein
MSDLELIMADVTRSWRTATPIYDGTARAIAAGFHGGNNEAFTSFSSTGAILADFIAEIQAESAFVERHAHNFDPHKRVGDLGTARQNLAMLAKLAEYAAFYGTRGPVERWSHVWADKLAPEDEYNGCGTCGGKGPRHEPNCPEQPEDGD